MKTGMGNLFRFLFGKVFILISLSIFFSFQNFAYSYTQITIPSPDTQPQNSFKFSLDARTTFFRSKSDGGYALPNKFGILFGVYDSLGLGAELGIDLREPASSPFSFNAKVSIKEDFLFPYSPGFTLGIFDLGFNKNHNDNNIFYALISRTIPILGRLSAGGYLGSSTLRFDKDWIYDKNKNQWGWLISFDRVIAELDQRLWFSADFMIGKNRYGSHTYGLSWKFSPNISLLLGYQIFFDEKISGKDLVVIRFDIDF